LKKRYCASPALCLRPGCRTQFARYVLQWLPLEVPPKAARKHLDRTQASTEPTWFASSRTAAKHCCCKGLCTTRTAAWARASCLGCTVRRANPDTIRVIEKQYEENGQTKRGTTSFGENGLFSRVAIIPSRLAALRRSVGAATLLRSIANRRLSPLDKHEHQKARASPSPPG